MKKKNITALSIGVLLCGLILFLLLPHLINFLILPKLVKKLPFAEEYVNISSISPRHLKGSLAFHRQNEGIFIPNIELQYSYSDLFKGRVSSLLLDGATVHFGFEDGALNLRGLQINKDSSVKKKSSFFPALPISIKTIIIKNSTIIYHQNNTESFSFRINGSANITYEETENGKKIQGLDVSIVGSGLLNTLLHFKTNFEEKGSNTSFDISCNDLSVLPYFLKHGVLDTISGKGVFSGYFKTGESIKDISYSAKGLFDNFSLRRDNIEIANSIEKSPLEVTVKGDQETASLSVRGISVTAPQKSKINLSITYGLADRELDGKIKLYPELLQAALAMSFHGTLLDEGFTGEYSFSGDSFQIKDGFKVAAYTGKGTVRVNEGVSAGQVFVVFPRISDPTNELILSNFTMDLPIKYPFQSSVDALPGNFGIEDVRFKGKSIAKIKSSVVVGEEGAAFDTFITTPIYSGAEASCRSTLSLEKNITLRCTFQEAEVDTQKITDGIVFPDNFSLKGKLSGLLLLEIKDNIPSGHATINYHDGVIRYKESSLSEISLGLSFPYLPKIQSSPGQICTIGTIDLGKIKMHDAKIQLRVDDKSTLFIEKAKMNWCGGRVETGALTLFQGMQNLETTLYCDRLGYTELLGQLGIGDAEGEGTLNGRLPLDINREGIKFDDGFLFSTPGSGGIVRFNNTSQLRQGMGAVEKSAYLDYSLKALENFSYNWTKLRFTTENEELLLSLQLDGKPAQPLPYGYQQGQLVKKSSGPGVQHPIRLDVNFRLPMNDIFRYGKSIQSLMEKM